MPSIRHLRVESLLRADGIDRPDPRFSWQLQDVPSGHNQEAWRIRVWQLTPEKQRVACWDSGEHNGTDCHLIRYAGDKLQSSCHYIWQVGVRIASEWLSSAEARFLTGRLPGCDWHGSWIGCDQGPTGTIPARLLRREFTLPCRPARAVVHWSGLGLCELSCNGQRVDDRCLDPAISDYRRLINYRSADITALLQAGDNCLGAWLGNGRFSDAKGHDKAAETSPLRPQLRLHLTVHGEDGSQLLLGSDGQWQLCDNGPIGHNSEYTGEHYDERREIPNWNRPDLPQVGHWQPAQVLPGPGGDLRAQPIPGIHVGHRLAPTQLRQLQAGIWILRCPHYISGRLRLRLRGLQPGEEVVLRYGERLDEAGRISQDSLRSAISTDRFIAGRCDQREWEPRFTIHGFEYVQIEGLPQLNEDDVRIHALHDELAEGGRFACSSAALNRVIANVQRVFIANYRNVPLDSPARDERQGWMGDHNLLSESEACLFDLDSLYRKWLRDVRDTQQDDGNVSGVAPAFWPVYLPSATWSGAYVQFTLLHYRLYGDAELVRAHYPALVRWMDFISAQMDGDIVPIDMLGDWCPGPEAPEVIHTMDPSRSTLADIMTTTFFADQARMMAELAAVAEPTAVSHWQQLAAQLKRGLNERFFDPEHGSYGNGSATANLLPLAFDLVPAAERERVLSRLLDRVFSSQGAVIPTGMVGAKVLLRTLSRLGRADAALAIAESQQYPSWGYMIRHGATAMWELLNGHCGDPAMNSTAQPMHAGDVVAWAFEDLAGLRDAAPGFRRARIAPVWVAGLEWVEAERHTPAGRLASRWQRRDGRIELTLQIPPGMQAELLLPQGGQSLEPGEHRFVFADPAATRQMRIATPQILPGNSEHPWASQVAVAVACPDPEAKLRVTIDGSLPNQQSPVFQQPIWVTQSSIVRARAFRPGREPSSLVQALIDPYDPNVNGTHYRYYELPTDASPHLPDYARLSPQACGRHAGFDVHRLAWQIDRRKEYWGASFRTRLQVPHSGEWRFFLRSHNSSRLWLDGQQLIDNDDLHVWTDRMGRIQLAAGDYELRVDYLQLSNDFGLFVSWQGPQTPFSRIPTGRLRFLDTQQPRQVSAVATSP